MIGTVLNLVRTMPPVTMNMLETLGLQSTQIVRELNETFPPVNPTPHDSIETIMYKAGQRHVVEWIIQQMEQE